ncbi:cobinamide adenolsyltransferase [candidate division TA06 bacterium DG_26]|uniref:Cobinamide adenolsyltransferase n=1 Tax=candidate division TA06 bacterium DG_26 TaxID=1703771 RepID=A0A0S7WJD0_UNCT6|nr:MAG: cobinamide adenolsyltransferase [candidate division TA06 bacterium DG_26]
MQGGLIQVYTGAGKGKTTAAIGQAIRACGHGLKAIMIQFMKGKIDYGELAIARLLDNFTIEQYGLDTFVEKGKPTNEDLRLAKAGFKRAQEVVDGGQFDLVILDEINVAVDYELIPLQDVLELMRRKPDAVELVLTGRYAHPQIVRFADLVTEMVDIKHHYAKGVRAREGIEY